MTKDIQGKCEASSRSRNISVDIFFIDPIFILQNQCRLFIFALDTFQEVMRYVFKLPFHADDDAKGFRSSISRAPKREQIRHGHPAQHQDALLNSSMLRSKLWKRCHCLVCKSCFRMCMFQIFACKSVWFCMWTKSLTAITQNLELSRVVLSVKIRVLNFV